MCGILGWLGTHAQGDAERFEAALDLLAHRGPDDSGIWSDVGVLFGHRRLSIVDLTAAGHQPMRDSTSGATILSTITCGLGLVTPAVARRSCSAMTSRAASSTSCLRCRSIGLPAAKNNDAMQR